ncbi:MAG: ketopantoate reductase family protein [Syntrophobacteraceae bacterium]
MQILVLGAGAMGSLLGARLARTDASVSLFSIDREHIEAIQRDGLLIEEMDGTVSHHRLPSIDSPDAISVKPDLVLVTVKSYATDIAVESVKPFCSASTVFLTLQNGTGNWQRIAQIAGRKVVLAGTTAQGATLVGPGRVRHGGNGATFIGEPEGQPSGRVTALVDRFAQAGLHAESSDHMEWLIWEKLMVNVGINAITALTGIRNGVVAELQPARELSRAAVREAMEVAEAAGFPMQAGMEEKVLSIARATARNRSSMGQDVDARKRTEIDSINGAIVRLGRELHVPTPINLTLTNLVRIVEAGYGS